MGYDGESKLLKMEELGSEPGRIFVNYMTRLIMEDIKANDDWIVKFIKLATISLVRSTAA